MFRLIRLVFLVGAAFVAGVLYERGIGQDRCLDAGGSWTDRGLCIGPGGTNDG